MTGFIVPIPTLPPWVRVVWTPTNAAAVVWCSRCGCGNALYTTVLRRDPNTLTEAVQSHGGCAGKS